MHKKEKEKTEQEKEIGTILEKPEVVSLIYALACLMFSNTFYGYVVSGQWAEALFWAFITWLGCFFFWAGATSFVSAFIGNKEFFQNLGKWKTAFISAYILVFFTLVYYSVRFILLK